MLVYMVRDLCVIFLSSPYQIVIGIGAKPAVSPFESVGLNSTVGGIQVIISA